MGKVLKKLQSMTSIVVWNLSYFTTAKDLKQTFEKFGEVGDVYIPMDKRTRESRGFAFVRFFQKRDAEEAKNALHKSMLNGREVRVNMAHKWQVPRGKPWRQLGRFSSNWGYRSRSRTRSRSWSRSRSRSSSIGSSCSSRSSYFRSRRRSGSSDGSATSSQATSLSSCSSESMGN